MTRRGFLRVGSLSLLGMSIQQYLHLADAWAANGLESPQKKAEACILIWLEGGPSHMDTFDPKPNSRFKPIATNVDGIQVSELLPGVARHMDKLAIIRSMKSEENNHPQGGYYALTGHRPTIGELFPSFGSVICKERGPRNAVPPYLLAPMPWETYFPDYKDGFSAGFLGPDYDPMVLPDPSGEDFEVPDLKLPKGLTSDLIDHRRSFLKVVDRHCRDLEQRGELGVMNALSERALTMVTSPEVKKAFDLSRESEQTRDAYGRDRVGQSVLLARRLVESGARFVTASGYGYAEWDTHADNDELLREKLGPTLDRTLSTLIEDLEQRGLLETTLVVVMGEFGRTPKINPNGGRDHWPDCWSLALAGGGIRGGQVIGASDEEGAYSVDGHVAMGDVFATIYKAFGIDFTKTYETPFGRPVYIANGLNNLPGRPLTELL